MPFQIETLIIRRKQEHPSWGAPEIREKIRRLHSEVAAAGDQHRSRGAGSAHRLVSRGRRARYHAEGTTLSKPTQPNDLWCADYKGEFMLADRRYCYPLTVTDFASRYLLFPPSRRGACLVEHLRQLLALLLGGPLTCDAMLVRPLIRIGVPSVASTLL